MSYTEIFSGETINPAQLSYIAYESAVSVALVWPLEAPPDANVAADKIDVEMTTTAKSIIMPPADQISVGQDVLVRNVGANTFTVLDFDGTEIGSIASGEAWYFVVIDNTTEAGDWYAIEFGVGTSSATAASLAGAGLRANANRLDQNLPTTALAGDYAITTADRATVLQNEGGTVVWTFASAVTLTEGWFVYVINAGTGSITLTPAGGQTLDGASTKVIEPTESLIVFSDGANLHSLGYGRTITNLITGVSIDAAGMGTLTLTDVQVQAQVQDYVGTLTGNRIAEYGNAVGYWFVHNNTTGAFTLTLRTDSLDPGALVPQGAFSIARSNGTNMDIAFTASSGTVTEVDTGAGLTGGPITMTGTISMANTTVIAGAYGATNRTLTTVVNARGQLTAITAPLIDIPISQVDVMTSVELAARVSDETGTGSLVFAQSPALGTPTSLTLTNATGLPVGTGIFGLGTGIATFLATPSSANLATAVTDETGTGALVFANTPTLVNPVVGTQTQHNNSTTAASTAYVDRVAVQQSLWANFSTYVITAGTGMPVDNTIPQNTEGDQIMTLAITPKSTTSKLIIEAVAVITRAGSDQACMALFQDATANALTATVVGLVGGDLCDVAILKWVMTSGTTSATTFNIRVGSNTPAAIHFNGAPVAGALMGGVMASSISITEYGA